MATKTLTKQVVDGLPNHERDYFVWDQRLKRFGIKILPTGRKVYVVQYRAAGNRAARRVTLGAHGALTVEQARKLGQEVLGRVASGEDPAQGLRERKDAPTLNGLLPRFLARQASLRKPSTAAWMERLFGSYILPKLGTRRIAEISSADVARLHQSMSSKPVQANRVLAVLSSFCTWAEKEGHRPSSSNPCKAVDRFKERGREHFLTSDELGRLGRALQEAETIGLPITAAAQAGYSKRNMEVPARIAVDPDAIEAIRLLLFTGCRKSEILRLRWDEVDVERGLLVLGNTKTGKSVRPLNAPAREVLSRIPRNATSPYVLPGLDPTQPRKEITRAWYRIRREANLGQVRLHDLRHTYATTAVSGGASLPVIGAILGHTQASTTQRYAHVANHPLTVASERAGADMAAALAGRGTPITPLRKSSPRTQLRASAGQSA